MKGNFQVIRCEICEFAKIEKYDDPVSTIYDCSHEQARKKAIKKLKTVEDWLKFDCPYFIAKPPPNKVKTSLHNFTIAELLREAELSEDPLVLELARRLADKIIAKHHT